MIKNCVPLLKWVLCDNCGEETKPLIDRHINYKNLWISTCGECEQRFVTCGKCNTHRLCNTCNREYKIEIIIEHE